MTPSKGHMTSFTWMGTPFVPLLPPLEIPFGGVGAPWGDLEGHMTPPKGHVTSWMRMGTPFVPPICPPPSESHKEGGGGDGHLGVVTLRVT